jgi:hypothetical protein
MLCFPISLFRFFKDRFDLVSSKEHCYRKNTSDNLPAALKRKLESANWNARMDRSIWRRVGAAG